MKEQEHAQRKGLRMTKKRMKMMRMMRAQEQVNAIKDCLFSTNIGTKTERQRETETKTEGDKQA